MPQGRATGKGAGVSTGDVQGVGVAIGPNASVRIYGDVNYAPIMLGAPLREAFAPLLEDRTRLFGGRGAVVDRIGEFVRGPGGFLVITAPAGFGKTSLMASLVAGAPDAFAYHFFTPLYDADGLSEDFFLRNVVEQLAEWHGREGNLPEQPVQLRALYHQLLDEPLDVTQLLILDGLDEVLGWSLRPYLGRRLQERMHVIATVRDVGQDWQVEYGFPAEQTAGFVLEGLGRAEVVDVLESAGGAARALAGDPEAVDHVVRVAAFPDDPALGADPFYIRILAQDVADGTVDAATIGDRPPGLQHYLDEWWQEIKRAAGDEATRDLFGTLAAALGPVPRADLEHLNPSLVDAWAADRFDDVLRTVRRLVVEHEHGYSLVHPRLREYVRGKIKVEPYEKQLLELCRHWRDHASAYALSYGAYTLLAAGDLDALVGLVRPDWMAARLSQTGSHVAFAEDVALTHRVVLAMQPPDLVEAMRLTHVYAMLGSFASGVPPEVLALFVRLGRTPHALRLAALIPEPLTRMTAYRMIGEALLEAGEIAAAREALERALTAVDAAHEDRAAALGELAEPLAAVGRFEALVTRLDSWSLPEAAWRLGDATDAATAADALQQIADIAAERDDPEQRAYLLALVSEGWAKLGHTDRARALLPALEDAVVAVGERDWGVNVVATAAAAAARAGDRATALMWAERALAADTAEGSSVGEGLGERIARAYAVAGEYEAAMDVACRAVLRTGVPVLVVVDVAVEAGRLDALRPLLDRAVAAARTEFARSDVALSLARAGELNAAHELAASIGDEGFRAGALQRLCGHFAAHGRSDEAVAVADSLPDLYGRQRALCDIVRELARAGDAERAIDVAGGIGAAEPFAAIGEALLRAGDPARAAEFADRALDAAYVPGDRAGVVEPICQIARRLAERDAERADELIMAAVGSAERDGPWYGPMEALKTAAATLAAVGLHARAEEVFRRASALILKMGPGQYRDNYLTYLREAESEALRDPEPAVLADPQPAGEAPRDEDPEDGPEEPDDWQADDDGDWTARNRRRWRLRQRVDQLADEVQEMVQRGEWEPARDAAAEAVAAARAIDIEDSVKEDALVQAARIVAGAGDVAGGIALLGEVSERPRGEALDSLARAYADVGAHDHALFVWLRGFTDLELSTRSMIFQALRTAAWLIDDDEVLWRLCQAVLEVEHWWDPPATQVADP
jgi:hypothetical protein